MKIESRQLALESGLIADPGSMASLQKASGAYFTPDPVVATLLRWAVRSPEDRLLDPSCGDGRFVAGHRGSVGVEQDPASVRAARQRAPWAEVHEGDFFAWAAATTEQFDCCAGNPPFVRYQTFKGVVRERALALCRTMGVVFSGLSSSWAPFLVATASLLRPGGRMAFVVPAEIGHAPYAAPLLEYLVGHFDTVQLVAIRQKLFPELSEDCWLLYADGFGGRTAEIGFSAKDLLPPDGWAAPPRSGCAVRVEAWRTVWKRRLRPFLLPAKVRDLYQAAIAAPGARRLGDVARIGIGYVSGDNAFFHLRPSEAALWGIPSALLQPSVRNGRVLTLPVLSEQAVAAWQARDEPMLLLRLTAGVEVPASVQRYLDSGAGLRARRAFKCRSRAPWYAVPDVRMPDYFLAYMSGASASLVANAAGATCTNSVHGLQVLDAPGMQRTVAMWDSPFLALSREIEGHPLGGGMLKLEVREAGQIVLPPEGLPLDAPAIQQGLRIMQRWRHHG